MEQIREAELSTLANTINKKTVNITIIGDISASYILHNVQCEYNRKNGLFSISDILSNSDFIVRMSYVYIIMANKDRKVIEIGVDGSYNAEQIRITVI